MDSNEIWKDVIGYEGLYQVSDYGNIKSLPRLGVVRSRLLKHLIMPRGYHSVRLYSNGSNKQFLVHRLVAMSFLLNELGKPEVNHIDSDVNNNKLNNLSWCTREENVNHSFRSGIKSNKGSDNPRSKLCASDVINIRKMISEGHSVSYIASIYFVTKTSVYYIKKGKSWIHI